MKPRLVLSVALAFFAMSLFTSFSFAQEKLTDSVVLRVIVTAFPEIAPEDIKIKMKKKLTSRSKVNLEIKGRNAILYLKWKRYRNGARWWFEHSPEKSLVYLSKTYRTTRVKKSLYERKVASSNKKKRDKRTETIQVQEQVKKTVPVEKAAEPERKPEKRRVAQPQADVEVKKKAEPEKVVVIRKEEAKAEEPVVAVEKKVVAQPSVETEEKVLVEKKAVEVTAKPEPVVAVKKVEIAAEPEEMKVEQVTEVALEAKVAEEEEAVEIPSEERSVEPVRTRPVKETIIEPVEKKAAPEEEPARDPEVEVSEAAQEKQPVSIAIATGPEGTSKEFIVALVNILIEGREGDYRNFLLRPTEMAMDVDEKDFDRGVELWLEQFRKIHKSLAAAENVTVRQIILQRARTDEIERATLLALGKRIKNVNTVFTYVKINLILDNQPGYVSIGGLMQTDNGWRIGGRISFTQQLSLQ